jgi:hypothetical protein
VLARAAAGVGALAGGGAVANAASTSVYVLSGSPAPGPGGGTFEGFITPTLNAQGVVAFSGSMANPTNSSFDGIFLADGAGASSVARQNMAAPGPGGGLFSAIQAPALSGSGECGFYSSLTSTTDGSTRGVFRGDGSGVSAVARQLQAAPGAGGGTFSSFGLNPGINESGEMVFFGNLQDTTDGSTLGIFRGDGSTVSVIARPNQPAPGAGGGTFFALGGSPSINSIGQVAFLSTVNGGTSAGPAVFRGDGTILTPLARTGDAAPGAGGGVLAPIFGSFVPALNDAGQVAFTAMLSSTTNGSTSGIFRANGATLAAIARHQQPAPGAGGGTFASFPDSPIISADGRASFFANLQGTGDGSTYGFFRGDGSTVSVIARPNQPAPGAGGGTYATLGEGSLAMNSGGTAAFSATLSGTTAGAANDSGIFMSDGIDSIQVAREGDALAGSTIMAFSAGGTFGVGGRSSINDFGQVLYRAGLANGTQVLAVFTPDLHYRSSGPGSWDDSANWTVGITPAAIHDVLIDPALGLTVTGPAASATIKSLRIGATSAGTAALNLSAGGNLSVSGAVTVDASGRIDQSTGTLLAGSMANGGIVRLTGGTVSAPVTNTGEIQFAGPTAQVAGASLLNSGLIDGTGRIASASFTNAGAGTVRASAGEHLTISGAANTNDGQINLIDGGTVEFTQTLTNSASGVISGRGAFISDALINNGQVLLSGGFNDVFGAITNNSAGKVIISGGSTSTFYNPITNNAGSEFRVSTGSTAVFFGSVADSGAFTGTGIKDFEAGISNLGALATPGSTIVESGATVSAAVIREQALTVGGKVAIAANGTNAATSDLGALAIAGTSDNWTGQLDLKNNDAIVHSGAANRVADAARFTNQLKQGSNFASNNSAQFWTGNGITTSVGGNGSTSYTAVGVAVNDLGLLGGSQTGALYSSFDGQSVGVNDVLLKYTYFGDADLDGAVTTNDYFQIDNGFLGSKTGWINGDFDYDGAVTTNDYFLIDNAFLGQGAALAPAAAESAALDGVTAVPEPAGIGSVAVAAGMMSLRRRRRTGR